MEASQRPLELILARNLLTAIASPAFLVDADAELLFYNEAAGALLGISFEEAGRMRSDEWTSRFGPVDREGRTFALDELELTRALRDGRPAHSRFTIRTATGERQEIEASALPISGPQAPDRSGAIIIFWPLGDSPGGTESVQQDGERAR